VSVLRRNWPVFLAAAVAIGGTSLALRVGRGPVHEAVLLTLGEVQVVHAELTVAGEQVHGLARFGEGVVVETSADGRGRLREDDGTSVVVGRATKLLTSRAGLRLETGQIYVNGPAGARTTVVAAGVSAIAAGATVAVDIIPGGAKFYCASGEVVVRGKAEHRLRSGETATVSAGGEVKVAPEKAFVDWTGGMATPWSADGGKPRGSIGELWGRLSDLTQDDIGSPLAIRAHEVHARVLGEMAITEVTTTYFNAGSVPYRGDFRMAIADNALVSRFAIKEGAARAEEASLTIGSRTGGSAQARLEWAGEGWVRGDTGTIAPGKTQTVIVEYVEWLSPANDRLTYRYPMLGDPGAPAPLIGEFRARIDAREAHPRTISVGPDARVTDGVVEVRKADFRPAADLVVELGLSPNALGPARAYLAPAEAGDPAGGYLLVRTEAPAADARDGVTLALVVDTSLSIDPALLDAERALVEAILEGLGQNDKVVVLAADQDARAVGPATLGAVTPERRATTRAALAALRPGGATDLGVALERAADALPADAPTAMVIYVGDGWPTVGDTTVEGIRGRLSRRAGGMPRLGAVAVGPVSNRLALASLARGSAPVFEIADREHAAEVAVSLLAEALKPSVSGVEIDLGPGVERVYPRGAQSMLAGSSFVTVGRVRGEPPSVVHVRHRKGAEILDEPRGLFFPQSHDPTDVRRRWAALRVEELALRGQGRESAIDAALRAKLMTPWTGFAIGTAGNPYGETPLSARVLDLSAGAGFAPLLATPTRQSGALFAPFVPPVVDEKDADKAFKDAVIAASRRAIDDAMPGIRSCRDSRAALRPELTGTLQTTVTLDGQGAVQKVDVHARNPSDDDPALDGCVSVLIQSLPFFPSGLTTTIVVQHDVDLPPPRDVSARRCSATATLPVGLRRGVWRERLQASNDAGTVDWYRRAKAGCELPTWTDRRVFLELLLEKVTQPALRVSVARRLEILGEPDAAGFLRKESIRRAESAEELWTLRSGFLGDEPRAVLPFTKQYKAASTNEARLAVVQRFLKLAPHDPTLHRRQLVLLEALGKKDELADAIRRLRQDAFSDAALLAEGASMLRRLGDEAEAKRAFGELIERSPEDPFARGFVGDRLRDEGLFEEATTAYQTLAGLLPDDPSATLRLAFAHAESKRLDLATRMFLRVAQTGGRAGDDTLGELASVAAAVSLREALGPVDKSPDEAILRRRALEVPLSDVWGYVVVRAPTSLSLAPTLVRDLKGKDATPPDLAAPSMGVYAFRVERGEGPVKLSLTRPLELSPTRPASIRVDSLVLGDHPGAPDLGTKTVEVDATGTAVELIIDGAKLP
jgi:tetratricopeptide (TPR) repeat protein